MGQANPAKMSENAAPGIGGERVESCGACQGRAVIPSGGRRLFKMPRRKGPEISRKTKLGACIDNAEKKQYIRAQAGSL